MLVSGRRWKVLLEGAAGAAARVMLEGAVRRVRNVWQRAAGAGLLVPHSHIASHAASQPPSQPPSQSQPAEG